MLVFQVGGKPEYSEENPRSINQEPTTNSSNIQHQAGIKPRPCWWQVSALATAPLLLLISAGFSFKMEELEFLFVIYMFTSIINSWLHIHVLLNTTECKIN